MRTIESGTLTSRKSEGVASAAVDESQQSDSLSGV